MKLREAKFLKLVVAKTTGYGRLTKGKMYYILFGATKGDPYVTVKDDTGFLSSYHIRNFSAK
jgi:hypothetical protein